MTHWENASADVRWGRLSLGYYGHVIYDNASDIPEDEVYVALEGWGGDADVSYSIYYPLTNTTATISTTIKEGAIVYGRMSNLTITTGEVIAYYLQ